MNRRCSRPRSWHWGHGEGLFRNGSQKTTATIRFLRRNYFAATPRKARSPRSSTSSASAPQHETSGSATSGPDVSREFPSANPLFLVRKSNNRRGGISPRCRFAARPPPQTKGRRHEPDGKTTANRASAATPHLSNNPCPRVLVERRPTEIRAARSSATPIVSPHRAGRCSRCSAEFPVELKQCSWRQARPRACPRRVKNFPKHQPVRGRCHASQAPVLFNEHPANVIRLEPPLPNLN